MSAENPCFMDLAQYPRETACTDIIDLRSDTVTKPTEAMRKAMADCAVDDAVLGDDPTVLALETLVARLAGKEAAVFVPSGTMSNLIAIMSHCDTRGSEAIVGDCSHIHIYEQGGIATIAGVHSRVVPTNSDGTMSLEAIEACLRDDSNHHFPTSKLLCVENTHNLKGGCVLPMEWLKASAALANKHNIMIHTDGARAWHSAAALGLPLANILEYTDTASLCLSKGLGAPAGSVLVGPKAFIGRARRLRKVLGGGMRQIGVLGACGMVAVKDGYLSGALDKEHRKTRVMAEILAKTPGVVVNIAAVQTNLLYFSLSEGLLKIADAHEQKTPGDDSACASYGNTRTSGSLRLAAADVASAAGMQGVWVMATGPYTLRAVMNHHVSMEQAVKAATVVAELVQTMGAMQ